MNESEELSETKVKEEPDLEKLAKSETEKTDDSEPEAVVLPEESASFEIETLEDLQRIMIMAQGGNPDAQQTLNDFIRFGNNIERTNLPKREDVQRMIFADYAGKTLYPNLTDDPFSKFADSMATSFMAKGGDKSKQFVELMKQTPSLSELQTLQEQPQSIMDRLLRRDKEE